MTSAPTNPNPALSGSLVGYDPTGHQIGIAFQVGTVTQDATTGIWYAPLVTTASVSLTINSEFSPGTTAPSKTSLVGGKSNDGTPQYQPLPLGAGGRSIIIEGFTGGTGVPVTGTFWQTTQPVSAASLPLPSNAAQETGGNLATIVTDLTPFVTAGGGGYIRQDSTATIAKESGGNLATLAGIVSSNKAAVKAADGDVFVRQATAANLNATATIQVTTGTSLAPGSNAVPVLNSTAPGIVAAYGSNAAALTANTDYAFKWGASGTTQVNHVELQNNSTVNINYEVDGATNAGSAVLSNVLGQNTVFLDIQMTALHIQGNATPNVNGSSANNIVIRGWL